MNKTTKYLPIHKGMIKSLKKDMTVIHNGDTSRVGQKGFIDYVNAHTGAISVIYNTPCIRGSQDYSMDRFVENFYIIASDILSMHPFNGRKYFNKYRAHCKTPDELTKVQPKHPEIKNMVDKAVNKVASESSVLNEVNTQSLGECEGLMSSVISLLFNTGTPVKDEPKQDPLDVSGEYYIVNAKNLKNHGTAKTQRLANRQAANLAEKHCGDFLVLKKVSETEAVRTVNIKNI